MINDATACLRAQFADDGYLWVKQRLPQDSVNEWADVFQSFLAQIFVELYVRKLVAFPHHRRDQDYALKLGAKHGFREIVMRSPGRYELAILSNDPRRASILDTIQQSLPFVPDLLRPDNATEPLTWDQVTIQGMSLIVSTTGATDQAWHSDGGHMSLSQHLPCHCLNIFIPLTDLRPELGPTELRPHSHTYTRDLAKLMLLAKARKTLRPPVAPCLQKSDCLLFDYRLLHRGLAHTTSSQEQRCLLNLTVSLSWFKDVVNFPKRSMYDEMTEPQPLPTYKD